MPTPRIPAKPAPLGAERTLVSQTRYYVVGFDLDPRGQLAQAFTPRLVADRMLAEMAFEDMRPYFAGMLIWQEDEDADGNVIRRVVASTGAIPEELRRAEPPARSRQKLNARAGGPGRAGTSISQSAAPIQSLSAPIQPSAT